MKHKGAVIITNNVSILQNDYVYMDVAIDDEPAGKLVFEVYLLHNNSQTLIAFPLSSFPSTPFMPGIKNIFYHNFLSFRS